MLNWHRVRLPRFSDLAVRFGEPKHLEKMERMRPLMGPVQCGLFLSAIFLLSAPTRAGPVGFLSYTGATRGIVLEQLRPIKPDAIVSQRILDGVLNVSDQ